MVFSPTAKLKLKLKTFKSKLTATHLVSNSILGTLAAVQLSFATDLTKYRELIYEHSSSAE